MALRKEPESSGGGEKNSLMLDSPDLLECPICSELFLDKPIYECKNRHLVCGVCCRYLKGRCRSCDEHIGDRRCHALEKILRRALYHCAFRARGCEQSLRAAEKREHESSCAHGPCACPFPGCPYNGLHLRDHVRGAHPGGAVASLDALGSAELALRGDERFRVLLHEPDPSRVYLLLNDGQCLSLLCLGPPLQAMEHTLVAKHPLRAAGMLELSASGAVPCARRLSLPAADGGYLVVPDVYWISTGTVSVSVSVRMPGQAVPLHLHYY